MSVMGCCNNGFLHYLFNLPPIVFFAALRFFREEIIALPRGKFDSCMIFPSSPKLSSNGVGTLSFLFITGSPLLLET